METPKIYTVTNSNHKVFDHDLVYLFRHNLVPEYGIVFITTEPDGKFTVLLRNDTLLHIAEFNDLALAEYFCLYFTTDILESKETFK